MRRMKGFTLVEIVIAIALMALIIGGVVIAGGVIENARVEQAASSIMAIRAAGESYSAAGNPDFTGVDLTTFTSAANNYLPAGTGAGTGLNPWGGDYTVDPNAANATLLDITLTGVPEEAQVRLNTRFANQANAVDGDTTDADWTGTF